MTLISPVTTVRFGHGNSGRHINLLISDFEREYARLKRLKPEAIKGMTKEEFVKSKLDGRGDKDWRK